VAVTLFAGVGAGWVSLIAMSLAGALLLYPVISLMKTNSRQAAKHVVHASVIYLPIVLIAGMMCKF